MALHPVNINEEETTVGTFLEAQGVGGLEALLACDGIVHFTRGGERNQVTSLDHTVHQGDFVAVADQCPTGEGQTVTVPGTPTDFAFVIPGGGFGTNAENYMNRRPSTQALRGINTLDAILNVIHSGSQINKPIHDVLIVSHANVGGFLFFDLGGSGDNGDGQIDYVELDTYANDDTRPEITTRILRDGANVHIRGCNIGRAQPFLNRLKQAIGSHVTVTAPKYFDHFGHFFRGSTVTRYEFMLYLFSLFSPTQLGGKQQLVQRLQQKGFVDYDGGAIPDEWNTWVPQNIHANSSAVHVCTSPIDPEMEVERKFFHRHRNPLYRYRVGLDAEPPANQRVDILRSVLEQEPLMQSSHAFPQYKWFGYDTLDAFVDGLHWDFTWNAGDGELHCAGSRHEYELRIPITDGSNTLLINTLPDTGARAYQQQDLVETDSRFFGSA